MAEQTSELANTFPSFSELDAAFAPYISEVGSVVNASNRLQEALGQLFVPVTGISREMALAIWYSSDSDRAQRAMLRGAVVAAPDERFSTISPNAKPDLLWLLERANVLSDLRNDAIHAPCSLAIDCGNLVLMSSYFHGNPRAAKLRGKDILAEFRWYQISAAILREYAGRIETALQFDTYSWPDRPTLPNRPSKQVSRSTQPTSRKPTRHQRPSSRQ